MSLTCCYEDNGFTEFSRRKTRVARKPHICCECREEISVGVEYVYCVALTDGQFSDWKTCEKCDDLAASMQAMGFCGLVGDVHADHQEYIREYQPPRINI